MKKLLVVFVLALVLAGCESPKRSLELGEVSIENKYSVSILTLKVINNTDMDIYANIVFKLDGTGQQTAEKGCWFYMANTETELRIGVLGVVEDARAIIKKCE